MGNFEAESEETGPAGKEKKEGWPRGSPQVPALPMPRREETALPDLRQP